MDVLMDPKVLLTFLATAAVAGLIIWLLSWNWRRRLEKALEEQRRQQEGTVSRLFDSLAHDKEELARKYEEIIAEKQARIEALEKEVTRLRDRLSQGGLLSLFGRGQREAVSALLLENEQLHEQIARLQEEMRDLVGDLTGKLMERLEKQYQESARAVRYKQALLSTFLQQEEARQLLERMLAEGRLLPAGEAPAAPSPQDEHPADQAQE
ncbi:MAG: hypothetical protein H5T60_06070 [Anaerolineae bacterium]|nr:hypothetical protein [Anaerolineae bacterium]